MNNRRIRPRVRSRIDPSRNLDVKTASTLPASLLLLYTMPTVVRWFGEKYMRGCDADDKKEPWERLAMRDDNNTESWRSSRRSIYIEPRKICTAMRVVVSISYTYAGEDFSVKVASK